MILVHVHYVDNLEKSVLVLEPHLRVLPMPAPVGDSLGPVQPVPVSIPRWLIPHDKTVRLLRLPQYAVHFLVTVNVGDGGPGRSHVRVSVRFSPVAVAGIGLLLQGDTVLQGL